jgi:predicted extracellular nuclease
MTSHNQIRHQFSSILLGALFLVFLLAGCQNGNLEPAPSQTPESVRTDPTQTQIAPSVTPLPVGETIAEVQGAGHISPFRSLVVSNVGGIVTVVKSDGFYMQSTTPDDDPATSEGLFVYTERIPTVRVGDNVLVNGRVEEFVPGGGYGNLSTTRLKDPDVEIQSRENPLPAPTIIGQGGRIPPTEIIDDDTNGFISKNTPFDPENDGIDFYESMEGMLVQVNHAVVVGPTNAYKEIAVLADNGEDASVRTPRGGIVVREDDFNPERIILDDLLTETPFVKVGDYSDQPIIGVIDYDFGNFKLLVTEEVEFISGGLLPEEALQLVEESQLRVATYNVLNLPALETRRLAYLASQIVNQMASPDIIGLQEIQDNDGSGFNAVSADQTYQGIIDEIIDMGGPPYGYVDIDPIPGTDGGAPGGNIRQGFLYRLDRGLTLAPAPYGDAKTAVQVADQQGVPVLSLNPGRIEPDDPAFYASRKPLVVTFLYRGEPLFLINNHFVSKGADRDLFGEFQPPLLDSEIIRIEQARIVHDFVAQLLVIDPDARVIVLGDLNDFQFSPPIDLLEGEILVNLVETMPVEERYSYIYDGNSQTLDQMLVSEGWMPDLVSMDILHFNSEFDYESRFSDHDPLVATFEVDW